MGPDSSYEHRRYDQEDEEVLAMAMVHNERRTEMLHVLGVLAVKDCKNHGHGDLSQQVA